jgi:hypothetical protein
MPNTAIAAAAQLAKFMVVLPRSPATRLAMVTQAAAKVRARRGGDTL